MWTRKSITAKSSLNVKWRSCRETLPRACMRGFKLRTAISFECLKLFCLLPATQYFFQRDSRFFLLVQHGINLIDDRRLDLQLSRAFKSAPRSGNSFGHHLHGLCDLHE